MNSRNWQRARSNSQVDQRINEILTAAEKLFRSLPYDKITLQKIAVEAKFTLSNIYRYFKTKEEIFLHLYISDITSLADTASAAFTLELSIEDFSDSWTQLLSENNRLLELSSLLAISLERNSSEEVYRNAKLLIVQQSSRIAGAVSRVRPSMNEMQINDFIKVSMTLMAGAWPLSRLSDNQNRIIDELGVQHIKIDFFPFYRNTIKAYLTGL